MEVNPVDVLKDRLKSNTQLELGKELGISQALISLVANEVRKPTPQLLSALGIEKRITYHLNGKRVKK